MRSLLASPSALWQSCAAPSAAWFLVWMSPALLLLDAGATLSSAMARLLAVLVVAGLLWARGLGPGGDLADRVFVAAWAASWAAVLGTLVTSGSWSSSAEGSVALFATLFIGAGWLGWAFHERHELLSERAKQTADGSVEPPGARGWTILAAWLIASSLLALLVAFRGAHWSEGLAQFVALSCFTAFQSTPVADEEPADTGLPGALGGH